VQASSLRINQAALALGEAVCYIAKVETNFSDEDLC